MKEIFFYLDIEIAKVAYNSCQRLGQVFGYGAFEGMVMYMSVITLGIFEGIRTSKRKKNQC